jgi:triacylglycerol lipase
MPSLAAKPFEPFTAKYRPVNAYWMATLAKVAYIQKRNGAPDRDKILRTLKGFDPKYSEVAAFNADSSEAIVVKHEDYIVASFRGTDEIGDWLDNLNAVSVAGPLAGVHNGFYKALMDVWPDMKRAIRNFRRTGEGIPDRPLWLTGHSLGGALATLAAATLIEADEPFYGGYTFGAPRVGDRDFARIFNNEARNRFFRFQNNSDIVTRVPARLMGYSHVGGFVYISAEGELSDDIGWWYRFVDTVQGIINDIGDKGLDMIEDHDIDDYIAGIDKYGDRNPE